MKANQNVFESINSQRVIRMLGSSLLLLFSFAPGESKGDPHLPGLKKELKMEGRFHRIRIDGDVSVRLTNEPAGTVVLEGNERSLSRIKHSLVDNTLVIDASRKNFFAKLTIYLSAITLQDMQINGFADITSVEPIQSDLLHIFLNGDIDVTVKTLGKLSFDTPEEFELQWKKPTPKR
jgi:hypothetical protein